MSAHSYLPHLAILSEFSIKITLMSDGLATFALILFLLLVNFLDSVDDALNIKSC